MTVYWKISQEMSSLNRICLCMIFIAMVSLSDCTQTKPVPWDVWNGKIRSNLGVPLSPVFSYPVLPQGWSRNYNPSQLSSTPYSTRKYQYLNYYNYGTGQCLLYCGPRSFLITDSNGLLICQRDNTNNYWGGITDNGGNNYTQYCIPNFQSVKNCANNVDSNLANLTEICNQGTPPLYGSYNSCCFWNSLKTPFNGYDLWNEVDFSATTSYSDLLVSQN